MHKKILIFLTILILFSVGGYGFYFWLIGQKSFKKPSQKASEITPETPNETKPEPPQESLLNMDAASVDSQAKENLALATEKALQWRSDAVLVYLQIKLESLEWDKGMETYVFDSPSLPNYHFTITISQETKRYMRAAIPVEDYLGTGLLPIDFKYWKLNYVSALQTAEKEGGQDFRENHLDWVIELNLKRGQPNNWLYWIIDYKTKGGDSLSVKVNPYSGEVIKEKTEGT